MQAEASSLVLCTLQTQRQHDVHGKDALQGRGKSGLDATQLEALDAAVDELETSGGVRVGPPYTCEKG